MGSTGFAIISFVYLTVCLVNSLGCAGVNNDVGSDTFRGRSGVGCSTGSNRDNFTHQTVSLIEPAIDG